MTDNEIKKAVITLFNKGCFTDLGDTDYLYNASEEILDKAYGYMAEIRNYGLIAFEKKNLPPDLS